MVRSRRRVPYVELSKFGYLALGKSPGQCGQFPGCLLERLWAEALVCRGSSVPPASLPCLQCSDLSNKHQELSLEVRATPSLLLCHCRNVNSSCSFAHLSLWGCFTAGTVCTAEEKWSFITFHMKSARQVTWACFHNVLMKSCRHVLWLQHLLCASAGLRNECVCVLLQETWVGVLLYLLKKNTYRFITLMTFHRKLHKLVSSSNVLPTFH